MAVRSTMTGSEMRAEMTGTATQTEATEDETIAMMTMTGTTIVEGIVLTMVVTEIETEKIEIADMMMRRMIIRQVVVEIVNVMTIMTTGEKVAVMIEMTEVDGMTEVAVMTEMIGMDGTTEIMMTEIEVAEIVAMTSIQTRSPSQNLAVRMTLVSTLTKHLRHLLQVYRRHQWRHQQRNGTPSGALTLHRHLRKPHPLPLQVASLILTSVHPLLQQCLQAQRRRWTMRSALLRLSNRNLCKLLLCCKPLLHSKLLLHSSSHRPDSVLWMAWVVQME
mmetsp:Transcript_27912/g.64417  ORF Transcript_27912/g.64417 Transcript_27912/m.64417 type:complete len:276 (-) Transcript_27912:597-1424(-)